MTREEKRAYQVAWRRANPEKLAAQRLAYNKKDKSKQQRKAYRCTNRELLASRAAAYRRANSDKVRAARLARYRADLEGHRAARRAYVTRNPEKARASTLASMLKREYGLTEAQRSIMEQMGGGRCWFEGCEKTFSAKTAEGKIRRLAIDHDKKSGRVRGLLCTLHNKYIVSNLTLEQARGIVKYLDSDFDGRNLLKGDQDGS